MASASRDDKRARRVLEGFTDSRLVHVAWAMGLYTWKDRKDLILQILRWPL